MTQSPPTLSREEELISLTRLYQAELYDSVKLSAEMILCTFSPHEASELKIRCMLLLADSLRQLEEYARATDVYSKIIQCIHSGSNLPDDLQTKGTTLWKDIFLCHYHRQYWVDAWLTFCQHVSSIADLGADTWSKAAYAAEQVGNFPEAVKCHQRVLKVFPESMGSLVGILRCRDLSQVDEDMSVPWESNSPWQNKYLESLKLMRQMRHPEAQAHLSHLSSIRKHSPHLSLLLAESYYRNGQATQAKAMFLRGQQRDKYCIDYHDHWIALLQGEGDRGSISSLTEHLRQTAPSRPESWVAASRYCEMSNDLDNAHTLIEKALGCDPNHPEALFVRGKLYMVDGKDDEAVAALLKSIELAPSVQAYQALVKCTSKESVNAEILERLRELSEIQPSNPHFKVLQGLIREVESTIEKDDETERLYKEALEDDPTCLDASYALAHYYNQPGVARYDDAIGCLKQATYYHSNTDLLCQVGQCFLDYKDNYDAAKRYFQRALTLDARCQDAVSGLDTIQEFVQQEEGQAQEEFMAEGIEYEELDDDGEDGM